MSDHCKVCTLRGHIRACEGTDCDIHENWYAQTLKNALAGLDPEVVERMVEALKDALSVLQDPVSQSVAYGTESFKSERTSELRGIIRALLKELEP